ncbi:Aste57867_9342 [Aphanomyces stellatus]|uniref:Aste57867_9342 protein n=1 Tax=Aphanomyces stellatus TaxID=120398 RepID=A0A485KMQ0_9STRA|nr:hypothetical protein As57867_009306 [Aphanomyces stellatus]VFT86223.1 Aste57867_9342 [Aphanomyces stellatus]
MRVSVEVSSLAIQKMLRRAAHSLWLVDPVTRVANEFSSDDDVTGAAVLPLHQPSDVAALASFLHRRGLTSASIQSILDRAGVTAAFVKETTDILDGYAPMDEEYVRLRVPLLPGGGGRIELAATCVALTFECITRDQGTPAAEPHCSPTRCHRWLEFEVLDASGKKSVVPRQDVCRMFRSARDYRCHVLTIQDASVLKHLTPGNHVALHVRADKSGSSNYAKYARISLHYAVMWKPRSLLSSPSMGRAPASNVVQRLETSTPVQKHTCGTSHQPPAPSVVLVPPSPTAEQRCETRADKSLVPQPRAVVMAPQGPTKSQKAVEATKSALPTLHPSVETVSPSTAPTKLTWTTPAVDVAAITQGLKDTSWETVDSVTKKPIADEWVDVAKSIKQNTPPMMQSPPPPAVAKGQGGQVRPRAAQSDHIDVSKPDDEKCIIS